MNGWAEGIQEAIEYMESHLTEEIDIREVAAKAHVSAFHFQRIFSALCGFPVGEYLRNRRLTLAAQELSASDAKVIDVALRYGYDSPDSFARAFIRFHGVSPSSAKEKGASLRSFAPLRIKLTLEGGTMMEYRIEEKPAFTVMGRSRTFSYEDSYRTIPAFWTKHQQDGGMETVCGAFGVCLDMDAASQTFDYLIADNYIPWQDVPEGYVTHTVPAGTWAIFPCRGALPEALQAVNTKIWDEWLPNCREYCLAGSYNIELYASPAAKPEDTYSEIWIPVKKA